MIDMSLLSRFSSVGLIALVLLLSGCKTTKNGVSPEGYTPQYNSEEYILQATLFVQYASEYRALCFQAYNGAMSSLEHIMMTSRFSKPPCVVLDIDETVLDNSPYSGEQVISGQPYSPATWKEWTALAEADTVPGVGTFLHFAKAKGAEIFYVSNRSVDELLPTVENLQDFGLPYADTNHVFLKTTTSNKQARRERILETNAIAMLIGDNLNDLSEDFENLGTTDRQAITNRNRDQFGKHWIVLPNPIYGSWSSNIVPRGLTPAQQDSVRHAAVKGFRD